MKLAALHIRVTNFRHACAARVTVVVLCVGVWVWVCPHAILAVRAIISKTKDTKMSWSKLKRPSLHPQTDAFYVRGVFL